MEQKIKSSRHWKEFWKKHNTIGSKKLSSYQRVIYKFLEKEIKKNKNFSILNAGAGIDLVSYKLKQKYPYLNITLLDISQECLKLNKRIFESKDLDINYKLGDIFNTKLNENSFDIIFNSGVMEHFNKKEQKKITLEMLRVLKNKGKYLTFNPSVKGDLYVLGKTIAEQKYIWPFGIENPIISFCWLKKEIKNIEIKEYDLDGLSQFNFTYYIFPRLKFLLVGINLILNLPIINFISDFIIKKLFGTYLILSEIQKK